MTQQVCQDQGQSLAQEARRGKVSGQEWKDNGGPEMRRQEQSKGEQKLKAHLQLLPLLNENAFPGWGKAFKVSSINAQYSPWSGGSCKSLLVRLWRWRWRWWWCNLLHLLQWGQCFVCDRNIFMQNVATSVNDMLPLGGEPTTHSKDTFCCQSVLLWLASGV